MKIQIKTHSLNYLKSSEYVLILAQIMIVSKGELQFALTFKNNDFYQ
jgi:hypothetical protein